MVWRGVPSSVTKNAFVWEAPDGSSVRAEYLPVGYGNGAALPDDAKALVRRTRDNVAEIESFLIDDLLCMNGSDHLMPQPFLGRVVAEANDISGRVRLRGDLAALVSGAGVDRGADPGAGRAALGLPGQHADGRHLEPGGREAGRGGGRARAGAPGRALLRAVPAGGVVPDGACSGWPGARWCATRPTTPSAPARWTTWSTPCCTATPRRGDIGSGLAERALKSFARSLSVPGVTVVNPSARTRSGVVELVVPADGPASDDVQVLSERTGLPGSMVLDADTVRTVLGMLQGPKISDDAWIHDVKIEDTDEGMDITIAVGTEEKADVPIAEAKQDVYTRLGARPDAVVRVAMDQPSTRRILARTGEVAGYGWAAFSAAALDHPVTATDGGDGGAGRSRCPTAWSPSRSTAPRAPSPSTVCPATGAWSTRATWATRTTTRRPGRTPWWTRRRRSRCAWTSRGRCGPGPASRPSTAGPTTSTAARRPGWASTRCR